MSNSRSRSWLRWVFIVVGLCALLACCGCPLVSIVGDPFERVEDVQPLAVIETDLELERQQHHAFGRDELVFRRESNLEVYRVDPNLTRLRTVPLDPEVTARFDHITVFPLSPFAVIYGNEKHALVMDTQTGRIDRRIP